MAITVREMRPEEARAFLEVHHAAVRGLAADDYAPEVIDDWAPMPVTDRAIEQFLLNPDGERRLVAECDGRIVGVGALVIDKTELRACYVAPEASRQGVGSALVGAIERIAQVHGLPSLELDSSVTAEPFYRAHGYEVCWRSEHILRSGRAMACVKMVKKLDSEQS
jgi:putative acetyltransferase